MDFAEAVPLPPREYFPDPFRVDQYEPPIPSSSRSSTPFQSRDRLRSSSVLSTRSHAERKRDEKEEEKRRKRRYESVVRLYDRWDALLAKYPNDPDDDEIDIRTGRVLVEGGKLQTMEKREFGAEIDEPDFDGQGTEGEEDEETEDGSSNDELAYWSDSDLEGQFPPPPREFIRSQQDLEDLAEFDQMEAQLRAREGSDFEEEEVDQEALYAAHVSRSRTGQSLEDLFTPPSPARKGKERGSSRRPSSSLDRDPSAYYSTEMRSRNGVTLRVCKACAAVGGDRAKSAQYCKGRRSILDCSFEPDHVPRHRNTNPARETTSIPGTSRPRPIVYTDSSVDISDSENPTKTTDRTRGCRHCKLCRLAGGKRAKTSDRCKGRFRPRLCQYSGGPMPDTDDNPASPSPGPSPIERLPRTRLLVRSASKVVDDSADEDILTRRSNQSPQDDLESLSSETSSDGSRYEPSSDEEASDAESVDLAINPAPLSSPPPRPRPNIIRPSATPMTSMEDRSRAGSVSSLKLLYTPAGASPRRCKHCHAAGGRREEEAMWCKGRAWAKFCPFLGSDGEGRVLDYRPFTPMRSSATPRRLSSRSSGSPNRARSQSRAPRDESARGYYPDVRHSGRSQDHLVQCKCCKAAGGDRADKAAWCKGRRHPNLCAFAGNAQLPSPPNSTGSVGSNLGNMSSPPYRDELQLSSPLPRRDLATSLGSRRTVQTFCPTPPASTSGRSASLSSDHHPGATPHRGILRRPSEAGTPASTDSSGGRKRLRFSLIPSSPPSQTSLHAEDDDELQLGMDAASSSQPQRHSGFHNVTPYSKALKVRAKDVGFSLGPMHSGHIPQALMAVLSTASPSFPVSAQYGATHNQPESNDTASNPPLSSGSSHSTASRRSILTPTSPERARLMLPPPVPDKCFRPIPALSSTSRNASSVDIAPRQRRNRSMSAGTPTALRKSVTDPDLSLRYTKPPKRKARLEVVIPVRPAKRRETMSQADWVLDEDAGENAGRLWRESSAVSFVK